VEGHRVRVPCWNPLERWLSVPVPLWGPAAAAEVSRLVRWADVLHVHDCLYPGSALAVLLARRRPVVLTQHIGFTRYRSRALTLVEWVAYQTLGRTVLRGASRVVAATPRAAAFVPRLLGSASSRLSLIANGVDTERFRPARADERQQARDRLGLPAAGPVVLFVGRLVPNKGVDLALEACRRLPGVTLVVVGDGPLGHLLAARPDGVRWLPAVPGESMPDCYRAADCLLLPSVDEGLPLAVQEAMASGLPVVVSRGEGYAAPLLAAGAVLAAPRTPEALAEAAKAALEGGRGDLGQRGRDHALAQWSVQAMAGAYLDLFQDLTGRR
jgi:glycosyltransferase involved in cell wall biosynthesis